jgi:hypothetical protein
MQGDEREKKSFFFVYQTIALQCYEDGRLIVIQIVNRFFWNEKRGEVKGAYYGDGRFLHYSPNRIDTWVDISIRGLQKSTACCKQK